jgi:hypothetical protein
VLLKPVQTQGREGMTTHQRITSILVFAALVAAAVPGTAPANSLLSGYGGPGEGNQAILGSALLNAPKGGGGGGGSGGAGVSQTSGSQTSGAQSDETSAPQSTHGSSGGAKGSARRRAQGTRATKTARGAASQAAQRDSVIYPAASHEVTTGGSRALGLSGADFVYIILALGVLALTGFLTVRLTRTAAATRGPTGTRG